MSVQDTATLLASAPDNTSGAITAEVMRSVIESAYNRLDDDTLLVAVNDATPSNMTGMVYGDGANLTSDPNILSDTNGNLVVSGTIEASIDSASVVLDGNTGNIKGNSITLVDTGETVEQTFTVNAAFAYAENGELRLGTGVAFTTQSYISVGEVAEQGGSAMQFFAAVDSTPAVSLFGQHGTISPTLCMATSGTKLSWEGPTPSPVDSLELVPIAGHTLAFSIREEGEAQGVNVFSVTKAGVCEANTINAPFSNCYVVSNHVACNVGGTAIGESGALTVQSSADAVWLQVVNGAVMMPGLPTSDPEVEGQLWNDSGSLKVSAG
jgi:hypothetical protein